MSQFISKKQKSDEIACQMQIFAEILILDEDYLVCLSVALCVFVSKFLPAPFLDGV